MLATCGNGSVTGAISLCIYALDAMVFFFFSSRRRHTRLQGDWSSDVCSSDLLLQPRLLVAVEKHIDLRKGAAALLPRLGNGVAGELVQHGVLDLADHRLLRFQIGRASCRERV